MNAKNILPKKIKKKKTMQKFCKVFRKAVTFRLFLIAHRRNKGWISADRTTKRTLQLTIPVSRKSSTKDVKSNLCIRWKSVYYKSYLKPIHKSTFGIRISRVSSLEAFSCYPTCGSFAALSFRTTAFTGYMPQRFLSYWVAVLSRYIRNSRIKLTCLATV